MEEDVKGGWRGAVVQKVNIRFDVNTTTKLRGHLKFMYSVGLRCYC